MASADQQSGKLAMDFASAGGHDLGTFVDKLTAISPALDLTEPTHNAAAMACADALLACPGADLAALKAVREKAVAIKDDVPFFAHLTIILAVSKKITAGFDAPFHCSMVFAVYGEVNRLKTKAENENGEDFLMQKIAQMDWVFGVNAKGSWDIVITDDGCPKGSGKACTDLLAERGYTKGNVNVVYLQDAIDKKLPVVEGLASTNDSRKGGAIQYGISHATTAGAAPAGAKHVICYTDADLSTHLGQCGLLLEILLTHGKDCAVGTRRMKDSITVKTGARNVRGKLHAYLWKNMMPEIGYIVDTQTAFKGFSKEAAVVATTNCVERKFAFDIELMLKTELNKKDSLGQAGIAWIDSEAESQSGDAENYVNLLKAIATIYESYLPRDEWRDSFGSFVNSLTPERFELLLDQCPEGIEKRDAADFATYKGVTPKDLDAACTKA